MTGVMDRLCAYSWPGNVRELQNVLERCAILSDGPLLDVPEGMLPNLTIGAKGSTSHSLADIEREHIVETLKRRSGLIEGEHGAARALGLAPSTLRSRMAKLGISRRDFD